MEQPVLLLLETGTEICSVAVSAGERILALRESAEPRMHARMLTVFVEEALAEADVQAAELDAVAYSCGPGSYMGLRIGASAAKGFCFALDIPLLPIDSLQALAMAARMDEDPADALYFPMIDARRMEVYTATYKRSGERLKAPYALVVEEGAFTGEKTSLRVFCGNGMEKCRHLLPSTGSDLRSVNASAAHLLSPALDLFEREKNKSGSASFENLISHKPVYLKEPHITKSRNEKYP